MTTEQEEYELMCNACSGSGEGSHDGSTCQICKGSGEYQGEEPKDDDWFWRRIRKAISKHKHATITTQSGSINEQGR